MSQGRDIEKTISRAKFAEEAGFDAFWLAHDPIRHLDTFQLLAVCAISTSKIKLGTSAFNCVTVHPVEVAESICTLDMISNGRSIMGLGAAGSYVYLLGLKQAASKELSYSANIIKTLIKGGSVQFADHTLHLSTAHRQIPLYLFAEGPRNLRLAGSIADGIVIGGGFTEEVIRWAEREILKGSRSSGRSTDGLELVYSGFLNIDDDSKRARDSLKKRTSVRAYNNFRFSFETVPQNILPEIEAFQKSANELMKSVANITEFQNSINPAKVPDYIIDRFCIAGNAADCVKRIQQANDMGVKHLHLTIPEQSYDRVLDIFARDIMPSFN